MKISRRRRRSDAYGPVSAGASADAPIGRVRTRVDTRRWARGSGISRASTDARMTHRAILALNAASWGSCATRRVPRPMARATLETIDVIIVFGRSGCYVVLRRMPVPPLSTVWKKVVASRTSTGLEIVGSTKVLRPGRRSAYRRPGDARGSGGSLCCPSSCNLLGAGGDGPRLATRPGHLSVRTRPTGAPR